MDSPPEPPEGTWPCQHLNWPHEADQTSDLQRRKIINLFGFQLRSLWLTAALGEESGAPGEGGDGLRGRRKLGQQCFFEN